MAYNAFKGILQYKSNDVFTKQAGFIYFVREVNAKGDLTGNAEVWFGTRKYGDVNATGLAELQRQITENATGITSIKNILGEWSAKFQGDISTVANAVVAVSADTKSIKDSYVSKFGGKTGEITVKGNGTTNGDVNLTMNNNQLEASIVGLGSAAFKEVDYFDSQIEEVNNVLTAHTGNTDIHITSDERAAWNKAKEDIDVFLSGNTVKALDTLKEIQDYISKDGEAANNLVSAIASAQTAADTAQSGVDNLVSLVGTGFTNNNTVRKEINDVKDKISDATTSVTVNSPYELFAIEIGQKDALITGVSISDGALNDKLVKLNSSVGSITNAFNVYTGETKTVLEGINNRLTAITNNAITSITSTDKTITVTDNNIEVNTLSKNVAQTNGYIALEKTNDGALYGVMYYGGDDAE